MKYFISVVIWFCVGGTSAASEGIGFTYNGFRSINLTVDGTAKFTDNGLLQLTNFTKIQKGHAFYPYPIRFKNSLNHSVSSFSTTFVFAIVSEYPRLGTHGLAFVITPRRSLPGASAREYLGLFNASNNGNTTNHVVAVELDTVQNSEFGDINENHVGIDINGLKSEVSRPAGYYGENNSTPTNLSLISGQPIQVWVEYNGKTKKMEVTLAPIVIGRLIHKPMIPLLSLIHDLSPVMEDTMYVGFSSSTGSVLTSHYVLGWSFKINGMAQALDISQLPNLPRVDVPKNITQLLNILIPLMIISFILVLAAVIAARVFYIKKQKFAELLEDWELDYGTHRFRYKDLYVATNGFKDEELLGRGGFGRVYKGVLPSSKFEVAVKRVSHESRQGMKEFISEVVSIGRLRHRNIVPLLGYCRRQGELLLVYEYMPNGSLDKFLYNQPKFTLDWSQRFRIIKGVASGLLYLHQGWEQVVIHRDVKASNVLLDGELNGRLGDFGLARLYDHGADPQTTHVVGTLGYLAPEHARTGKVTTSADVYSFGAFLLEVATGRKPIEMMSDDEGALILVDWVFSCWRKGHILEAVDVNLGTNIEDEIVLVLKLGLMCSVSEPMARPSMRRVVQHLEGDIPLPELSSLGVSSSTGLIYAQYEGFSDFSASFTSYVDKSFSLSHTNSSKEEESFLSGGR